MANCQECGVELEGSKKLCEKCALKKIEEMDAEDIEQTPDVPQVDDEKAESVDENTESVDEKEAESQQESLEEDEDITPQSLRIPRIIAGVIDGISISVFVGLTIWLFKFIPLIGFIGTYIGALISILFFIYRDNLFDSQSIGKKILGLKVIKIGQKNKNINTTTSVLRNLPFLIFAISNFIFTLINIGPLKFIAWVLIIVNSIAAFGITAFEIFNIFSTGKRFGDKFGGTAVIKA